VWQRLDLSGGIWTEEEEDGRVFSQNCSVKVGGSRCKKKCFTFRSKINGLDFMDAGEHKMTRSIGYFASKETGMFIHTGV
jgi:hypothetical protein